MANDHQVLRGQEICQCGSDTCICQRCAKVVCGKLAIWADGATVRGNLCLSCVQVVSEKHNVTLIIR